VTVLAGGTIAPQTFISGAVVQNYTGTVIFNWGNGGGIVSGNYLLNANPGSGTTVQVSGQYLQTNVSPIFQVSGDFVPGATYSGHVADYSGFTSTVQVSGDFATATAFSGHVADYSGFTSTVQVSGAYLNSGDAIVSVVAGSGAIDCITSGNVVQINVSGGGGLTSGEIVVIGAQYDLAAGFTTPANWASGATTWHDFPAGWPIWSGQGITMTWRDWDDGSGPYGTSGHCVRPFGWDVSYTYPPYGPMLIFNTLRGQIGNYIQVQGTPYPNDYNIIDIVNRGLCWISGDSSAINPTLIKCTGFATVGPTGPNYGVTGQVLNGVYAMDLQVGSGVIITTSGNAIRFDVDSAYIIQVVSGMGI